MKIEIMYFKKKKLTYSIIIFLIRISESTMPASQSRKKNVYNSKPLLTTGIRISCANRRKLYITYRKSNNPLHIDHYKSYCHILSEVIMAENEL